MKIILNYIGIVLLITSIYSCKKNNNTTKPLRKDLVQAVYASGKIYPVNHYRVLAKFPGYISNLNVKVGQTVKAGDTLAIIKNESLNNNTTIAQNNAELASRNIANLIRIAVSDLNAAQAKFDLDSINSIRFENLLKNGATSKLQAEQAKTQFEISKQNYLKAKSNYAAVKDKASIDANNANLNYKAVTSSADEFVIKAEKSGKIYNIDAEVGELVNSNKVLFEIGDDEIFEVELSVDETDINFLKTGQQILFTIDAFGEKIFKGSVKEIYPSISSVNRTSKVIADIEQNDQIISGLSTEANIIIQEKKNTLVIPREYIKSGNLIKLKNKEELVKIETGVSDLEDVEVINGISENEEIEK